MILLAKFYLALRRAIKTTFNKAFSQCTQLSLSIHFNHANTFGLTTILSFQSSVMAVSLSTAASLNQ